MIALAPDFVAQLIMEDPSEPVTPGRAFCILRLVANDHLKLGGDVVFQLLPALEQIELADVDEAVRTLQGCLHFNGAPEVALRVTDLQCKVVMMACGLRLRGLAIPLRIRQETIARLREGLRVRFADQEFAGRFGELWVGEERRWSEFLQSFIVNDT
jgi:hypothetical protein